MLKKMVLAVLLGAVPLHMFPAGMNVVAAEAHSAGWALEDGKWFFYDATSEKHTGWLLDDGHWYYLGADGAMQTGWIAVDGKRYFLDSAGVMQTGWVVENGHWFYLNSSGVNQTGWVLVAEKWYYITDSGMTTGWYQDKDTHWYYMDQNGAMQTGWVMVSGTWYYLDSHGVMQTGWLELGGHAYYLDSRGAMATGWKSIDASWFYFEDSGARVKGWKLISNDWYYFETRDGAMLRQNFADGYYLMNDGRMTSAGSSGIVSVVEGLKTSIDVGLTQTGLMAKLGNQYHDLTGIEGENYWLYTLSVTDENHYSAVKWNADDFGAEDLAKGTADIIVLVFWDSEKKANQVSIDYFNAQHTFHHYYSSQYDYQYD